MSVCVAVCVSACASVYTITQKMGSIHLKLEHIIVYENSWDEFRHWALFFIDHVLTNEVNV